MASTGEHVFFGFARWLLVGSPLPQHTLLSSPIVFLSPAFRFWMYGLELLSFLSTTPQGASHTFIRLESIGPSYLNDASVYPPAVSAIGCSKTLLPRESASFHSQSLTLCGLCVLKEGMVLLHYSEIFCHTSHAISWRSF